ncbi:restriction endonuclease [Rummeliibacillus stabekisii]|uniref:restriction endonuclease n=1 Tax=Rummeliibacillus stabekisii TaxID=241244 RepID=UPI00203B26AE|nr:restriction endonuclease [Rummeliibacillus stabekisii]MCM3317321.1 restriction endonuclease [Rummeliibacillus stabekisii]
MSNGKYIMPNSELLNTSEHLDKFIGEPIKIYNSSDDFIGKGKFIISFLEIIAKPFSECSEITITVKELDVKLNNDNYKLSSIVKVSDNEFICLNINLVLLNIESGNLKGSVHFTEFLITETDKQSYDEFSEYTRKLNWPEIKLPEEYAGKDRIDEAGAFEALCLDIISHWGGQNIEIIGKGQDRGRDGEFKIAAYSWIPILTDYSNSWILQCKYSKGYENLNISEIYEEVAKVIMHKPDYYLLMTNRKITNDFKDWFEKALQDNKYHIPFKCILINKTQIEQILAEPEMSYIKHKYFG